MKEAIFNLCLGTGGKMIIGRNIMITGIRQLLGISRIHCQPKETVNAMQENGGFIVEN